MTEWQGGCCCSPLAATVATNTCWWWRFHCTLLQRPGPGSAGEGQACGRVLLGVTACHGVSCAGVTRHCVHQGVCVGCSSARCMHSSWFRGGWRALVDGALDSTASGSREHCAAKPPGWLCVRVCPGAAGGWLPTGMSAAVFSCSMHGEACAVLCVLPLLP